MALAMTGASAYGKPAMTTGGHPGPSRRCMRALGMDTPRPTYVQDPRCGLLQRMEFELYQDFYRFLAKEYRAEQLVNLPDGPDETGRAAISPLGAYCQAWAGKSLSFRLEEAKDFRHKGNFNAAVAAVTNIAKDHVKSLREIQGFFDELAGRGKALVILSKFKQTFPLELGIDNGPDVLECVETWLGPWKEQQGMGLRHLMESERKYHDEWQELQVFERVHAGEAEAQELKEQAAELNSARRDLLELKTQLGIGLLELGRRFLTEMKELSSVEHDFVERLLRVTAPLTVVALSALLTKAGAEVDVDA